MLSSASGKYFFYVCCVERWSEGGGEALLDSSKL